jgi:fermentation-respiration switch protein FrsA (DUF1100 family)
MKFSVRRALLRLTLALVGAYLLVVVAACAVQRSLLYFPDTRALTPDPAGPPIQVVRLRTSDGQTLVAWYLPPAEGKPVILHFGGNGDSLAGQSQRWREIADAGVGFLAPGYRGYSGSSGHPTEAGLHRDAEAAYAWLAARYAPSDLVIMGHSLGTGVAVRLAADHPARALVLESPFTSAVDVGAAELPWLPVRLLMWDRYQSGDWIGRVHMPLLIVHGDRDGVIPPRYGRELYDLANQPKTFVRIVGGGHNDLRQYGLYKVVWRFLGVGRGATGPLPNRPGPRLSRNA